jgi:hypothetical protein
VGFYKNLLDNLYIFSHKEDAPIIEYQSSERSQRTKRKKKRRKRSKKRKKTKRPVKQAPECLRRFLKIKVLS